MKQLSILKNCIFILIWIYFMPFMMNAQYSCSTPHVISSLPFLASSLTTSSGASFQASDFCGQGSNYNEQDYIFKYTPIVDAQVSIQVTQSTNPVMAGIYVFHDCNQPLTSCVVFEESSDMQFDINFEVAANQDYYIFIGTDGTEDFDIEMSKAQVEGLAINKPEPTQTLDVNGAIRIGENTTAPYKGTIRWNDDNATFEGYNGREWVQLSPRSDFGYTPKHGLGVSASDRAAGDWFGYSVSISGDYAVVGAYGRDTNMNSDQGKAYVFKRDEATWSQEAILIASDGAAGDWFGYSVSIFEDHAVVGAHKYASNGNTEQGKAYVFKRDGSTWNQEDILIASDGAAGDWFGYSVSISGAYAVVGAHKHASSGNTEQGKAYVFKRDGSTWSQEDILIASDGVAGDWFGYSVSIFEDDAIVGAIGHDSNGNSDQGKAYVFKRSGTNWSQEGIVTASDGAADDLFGHSVSISGDYAVVGALNHATNGNSKQGKAYVYNRSGTNWIQESILTASDGKEDDLFGNSVAISGDHAIVGAFWHNTNGNGRRGKAYIYKRNGAVWNQEVILTASDGITGDWFGLSVSISGDSAIVGAHLHASDGQGQSGKVYFY